MIKETRELPAYLQFKKSSLLIKELKRVKGIFQLCVILCDVYFLCRYKEREISVNSNVANIKKIRNIISQRD